MRTAVLAFTQTGKALANIVAGLSFVGPDIVRQDDPCQSVRDFVAQEFGRRDLLVFIGAAAIAVRLIAPLLKDKAHDPAVLVVDELGHFVIPILSGHLGGANDLAVQLADALQAQVVITTATDLHGCFAVDVWSNANRCSIPDITKIKSVSSRLLAGLSVGFLSDLPIQGELPAYLCDPRLANQPSPDTGIWVSLSTGVQPFPTTLQVVPKVITMGVGCRKNTDPEQFETFILDVMAANHLRLEAISKVATIDLKRDECCIRIFCDKYGLEIITYTASELDAVPGVFQSSDFVRRTTGVDNVCERSAVLASQGRILLPRQVRSGMTFSLACENWQGVF